MGPIAAYFATRPQSDGKAARSISVRSSDGDNDAILVSFKTFMADMAIRMTAMEGTKGEPSGPKLLLDLINTVSVAEGAKSNFARVTIVISACVAIVAVPFLLWWLFHAIHKLRNEKVYQASSRPRYIRTWHGWVEREGLVEINDERRASRFKSLIKWSSIKAVFERPIQNVFGHTWRWLPRWAKQNPQNVLQIENLAEQGRAESSSMGHSSNIGGYELGALRSLTNLTQNPRKISKLEVEDHDRESAIVSHTDLEASMSGAPQNKDLAGQTTVRRRKTSSSHSHAWDAYYQQLHRATEIQLLQPRDDQEEPSTAPSSSQCRSTPEETLLQSSQATTMSPGTVSRRGASSPAGITSEKRKPTHPPSRHTDPLSAPQRHANLAARLPFQLPIFQRPIISEVIGLDNSTEPEGPEAAEGEGQQESPAPRLPTRSMANNRLDRAWSFDPAKESVLDLSDTLRHNEDEERQTLHDYELEGSLDGDSLTGNTSRTTLHSARESEPNLPSIAGQQQEFDRQDSFKYGAENSPDSAATTRNPSQTMLSTAFQAFAQGSTVQINNIIHPIIDIPYSPAHDHRSFRSTLPNPSDNSDVVSMLMDASSSTVEINFFMPSFESRPIERRHSFTTLEEAEANETRAFNTIVPVHYETGEDTGICSNTSPALISPVPSASVLSDDATSELKVPRKRKSPKKDSNTADTSGSSQANQTDGASSPQSTTNRQASRINPSLSEPTSKSSNHRSTSLDKASPTALTTPTQPHDNADITERPASVPVSPNRTHSRGIAEWQLQRRDQSIKSQFSNAASAQRAKSRERVVRRVGHLDAGVKERDCEEA